MRQSPIMVAPPEAPAPAGRWARKKAPTRQAIYDPAMRLFVPHGVDTVTIDDLCAAAASYPPA